MIKEHTSGHNQLWSIWLTWQEQSLQKTIFTNLFVLSAKERGAEHQFQCKHINACIWPSRAAKGAILKHWRSLRIPYWNWWSPSRGMRRSHFCPERFLVLKYEANVKVHSAQCKTEICHVWWEGLGNHRLLAKLVGKGFFPWRIISGFQQKSKDLNIFLQTKLVCEKIWFW